MSARGESLKSRATLMGTRGETVVGLSKDAVESAIDEIRPMLRMDGGDCEVVDVDGDLGRVRLRLLGACGCCPMSSLTLKSGIERIVKDKVPGVRVVETTEAA